MTTETLRAWTREETVGIFQHLCRTIAHDAVEAGGSNEDVCMRTTAGILGLLDGERPEFPACRIHAEPHPEDQAEHEANGESWYDGETPVEMPLRGRVPALPGSDRDPKETGPETPHALTGREMRDRLARHFTSNALYWSEQAGRDAEDIADGTAFSMLALLDGSNIAMPMFSISLAPEAGHEAERKAAGENWFADGLVMDVMLHEGYHAAEPEPAATGTPGDDGPG